MKNNNIIKDLENINYNLKWLYYNENFYNKLIIQETIEEIDEIINEMKKNEDLLVKVLSLRNNKVIGNIKKK